MFFGSLLCGTVICCHESTRIWISHFRVVMPNLIYTFSHLTQSPLLFPVYYIAKMCFPYVWKLQIPQSSVLEEMCGKDKVLLRSNPCVALPYKQIVFVKAGIPGKYHQKPVSLEDTESDMDSINWKMFSKNLHILGSLLKYFFICANFWLDSMGVTCEFGRKI